MAFFFKNVMLAPTALPLKQLLVQEKTLGFLGKAIEGDPDFKNLKAGTDLPLTIDLDIPENAEVTSIEARLSVGEPKDGVNQANVQQVTVKSKDGNAGKTYNVDVQLPEVPTNLTIRFEGGDPFWTFGGPLQPGKGAQAHTVPNFAEALNEYLPQARRDGDKVTLTVLLQSDSDAEIKFVPQNPQYVLRKIHTWTNDLDGTTQLERHLTVDFGTEETITLRKIEEKKVDLREVQLTLNGDLKPERLLGKLAAHDGHDFATVSADYAVAQAFMLAAPVECVGFVGWCLVEAEAEVYAELQADDGDAPATATPLAQGTVTLSPAEKGSPAARWTFFRFETPASLQADVPYWMVLRGIRGRLSPALLPSPSSGENQPVAYRSLRINRGGRLWKPITDESKLKLTALLRLIYLPDAETQTAALEVEFKDPSIALRLDPADEPYLFAIPANKGDLAVELRLRSHAQGTLTVANIVQKYVQST